MNPVPRVDRRQAIKWMLAASATVSMLNWHSFGAPATATGYGMDPDLMKDYRPGDLWPLTFSAEQRQIASALCDLIIPADDKSPSAASVGVPDFIDEWISAPYAEQRAAREQLVKGLSWLQQESRKRFKKGFVALSDGQRRKICNDICYLPRARSKFKEAASFFAQFRNLTAAGFYTTPQGWKDLQYIGNVPLTKFDGPPPEVLAYLKLS